MNQAFRLLCFSYIGLVCFVVSFLCVFYPGHCEFGGSTNAVGSLERLVSEVTYYMSTVQGVNVAVLVLVPILLAILFEYRRKYRRYFSYAISIWVSAILFHLFFGNIRYQYLCRQMH